MNGTKLLAVGGAMGIAAAIGLVALRLGGSEPAPAGSAPVEAEAGVPAGAGFTATRLSSPDRTMISDGSGEVVAVFTDGARTVRVTGPERTLAEPESTEATVTTDAWVRLAPREWREGGESADWFEPWLTEALADDSPDVFEVAMEYISDAPPQFDDDGLQIAGDANFGPVSEENTYGRAERSDFYDYLGVAWEFEEGPAGEPKPDHFQSLDCSGYLRMVYGYRLGYPLHNTNEPGPGLPRRAYAMAAHGPGALVIENSGERADSYERLQEGDLVFFNAGSDRLDEIEHSGIYLGVDSEGNYRFISSRGTINGPTLGDLGGDAILNGGGFYGERFLAARRI